VWTALSEFGGIDCGDQYHFADHFSGKEDPERLCCLLERIPMGDRDGDFAFTKPGHHFLKSLAQHLGVVGHVRSPEYPMQGQILHQGYVGSHLKREIKEFSPM